MRVLITSGTGKVGAQLTKRIFARGDDPIVMTHSLERLKDLPDDIEGVLADFQHPETWPEALKNIQQVCLLTPPLEDEATQGKAFAKFACESGIKQIVLLSIHKLEGGTHIPHFYAKAEMESVIKASKIPHTIIRSNNFFQNDVHFINGVQQQGMYTQPLGRVGLNRVDVRDVADAMANALTDSRHHFQTYQLVGSETLNGSRTAKLYSDLIGNKISYPENCLEIWEANFKRFLPPWQLEDWKMMYEFFLLDGLVANKYDIKSSEDILGRSPRLYEDYVQELLGKKEINMNDPFSAWINRHKKPGEPSIQT